MTNKPDKPEKILTQPELDLILQGAQTTSNQSEKRATLDSIIYNERYFGNETSTVDVKNRFPIPAEIKKQLSLSEDYVLLYSTKKSEIYLISELTLKKFLNATFDKNEENKSTYDLYLSDIFNLYKSERIYRLVFKDDITVNTPKQIDEGNRLLVKNLKKKKCEIYSKGKPYFTIKPIEP